MNDQKQQVVEKLKNSNNILVTVSSNPSVDQLAACIGLTLVLNKMGKHATAVFSGKVPSTLEFLRPERTIEKNTDSLRDFIIAIDKAKADKLRYKVEDEVVKIFITPYKSSIGEKDLIFSQGDFNVDVVMALGVHKQTDVDAAITAHGRILHDAVVISVNNSPESELGSINWLDVNASSLSELTTSLVGDLDDNLLDHQIATALLTGIVAETDHFSNQKTTPGTMTVSATLLAAGADQQLVATELGHFTEDGKPAAPPAVATPGQNGQDGSDSPLRIAHENEDEDQEAVDAPATEGEQLPQLPEHSDTAPAPELELEPLGLTADDADKPSGESAVPPATPEDGSFQLPKPGPSPFGNLNRIEPLASEGAQPEPATPPATELSSNDPQPAVIDKNETLEEIEEAVNSPHLHAAKPADDLDSARKAVEDALGAAPEANEPLQSLNAVPVDLNLGHEQPPVPPESPEPTPAAGPTGSLPVSPPEAPAAPPAVPAQPPAFAPPAPDYPPVLPIDPHVQPDPAVVNPTVPPAGAQLTSPAFPPQPMAPGNLPPNPAANEPAPLNNSPADQPFTMPLPPQGGLNIPPPPTMPPTSTGLPPQGPPPPPAPPPII